jgi:glycogen phosphorylase
MESNNPISKQYPAAASIYTCQAAGMDGFDSLAELALDLRSSWNHGADVLWRQLDPVLWELTHNPWVVLQTVARDHLERTLKDPAFRAQVEELVKSRRLAAEAASWFGKQDAKADLSCVAYFSMEFMLSEGLPIYSGGLGNVAGDQLKAASDLGVPVIGVGLLYQQGYFRQAINANGSQQTLFPFNDPGQLPITPLRQANGEWLRLEIKLPGYSLWLRAWQVQVGRVKLYLLDSNDAANFPIYRGITSELYGGGAELRINQEILLGIGGWRLLRALGIQPEVCHLNEGHAAFAVLERARNFMEETGQPFDVALAVTRAGNLFTTHTPVAAGFDRFSPALVEKYLGWYAKERLHISLQDLLALGRENPNDPWEYFNMAYLALRASGAVNGVSRLHGAVSRRIFSSLFPRWPLEEVPVGYVTNGVHTPTWDSPEADVLWTKASGKERWMGETQNLEPAIRRLSDGELWQFRAAARRSLVEYVRQRLPKDLTVSGASPDAIDRAKNVFDPNALTLGFARRFAAYKRPTLLLHDADRLLRIVSDLHRPVQLVIAGKAHPGDGGGQAMVQEWVHFVRRAEVQPHIVFLSDYDMLLAEHLVQGVDVWINTPRRPWEASGTSGMKVLVNGGLNLSELDGWWAEAYSPEVGWALGDGQEHGDDPAWDAAEAGALYDLLERQVVPEFYARDPNGIPMAWVARIRESMARLTPEFSANRAVRQYTQEHYLPAATDYRARAAQKGAMGSQIIDWQRMLREKWASVRFGEVNVVTNAQGHAFEVQVHLGEMDAGAIQVELYANGTGGAPAARQAMTRIRPLVGAANSFIYGGNVPVNRPASDYTPRILPHRAGVEVPLEAAEILWQR